MRALTPDEISVLEHEGVRLPWGSITTTAFTLVVGVGGLLVLTQQQLVDSWIGYVPALATVVPTVVKVVSSVQQVSKETILA
jgi:hypothetical protein